MRIVTESGRVFEVTPGIMFNGKVYEPEWFPEPRPDLFEIGFLAGDGRNPKFHDYPVIGDFLAIDFQGNGPFGKVWMHGPITEILP